MMPAGLTVDSLLGAIRHFLEADAASPEPLPELVLYGVPGDDVMKAVLEARGGRLVIRVQEVPETIAAVVNDEVVGAQAEIWRPSEERQLPLQQAGVVSCSGTVSLPPHVVKMLEARRQADIWKPEDTL